MGRPVGSGVRCWFERFEENVEKTTGCWLWLGLKNKKGYGRFFLPGKGMVLAHRLSADIAIGPLPSEICVLHRCDNPACVRPAHLFLGSRKDNNQDMHRKGRGNYIGWKAVKPEHRARGERVAKKMTDETVRSLRTEYAAGGTSFVKLLGKKYGIGHTTVENIVKRRKWAHVR